MMSKVWKGLGLAVVLMMLLVALPVAAQPSPPDPAPPTNTLRLYGAGTEDAKFPYDSGDEPFDLTDAAAPPKDFVVWNPAYFLHTDTPFTGQIAFNGDNANEKVFLRQWYVPKLTEPLGDVWTGVTGVTNAHIVKEYTYMLLDTDNNPVAGWPASRWWDWDEWWTTNPLRTALAFPMADRSEQIGLDSFDANGDGEKDIVGVISTNGGPFSWGADLHLATGELALEAGDEIQFLDHKLVIERVDADHDEIVVDVYYTGYGGKACGYDHIRIADNRVLNKSQHGWWGYGYEFTLSAGRHEVSTDAPYPIGRPWYFQIDSVVGDTVYARAGRLLNRGESFFVDGAEYAVAAIFTEDITEGWYWDWDCDPSGCDWVERQYGEGLDPNEPLKYITIRNPLPKGDGTVYLKQLSLWKCEVDFMEYLPFLPPFNMEHDIIDDVNLPEVGWGPDWQYMDNPAEYVDAAYDTVAERHLPDQPAALEYYIKETTEPRFNTTLDEARFYEPGELCEATPYFQDEDLFWSYSFPGGHVISGFEKDNECGYYDYFADRDGDYDVDKADVIVYCSGNPLTTSNIDRWAGEVVVEENPGGCILTADYAYYETNGEEVWGSETIDTDPNAYTEFVMPQVEDADGGHGDYILVSSFRTQDDARVKFSFDAAIGMVNSADVYVNDAAYNTEYYGVDENSLRLYGEAGNDANRPYEGYEGPFDITGWELPEKDFLVWDPAYFNHDDYPEIVANDINANEKVFLKQWYVPKLAEPLGEVWTGQEPVVSDHIVKEYTYILLDTSDQPTHGRPDPSAFWDWDPADEAHTAFKFPMADQHAQLGLDSFDVDGDGMDDPVVYDDIDCCPSVLLRTLPLEVHEGDEIRFLDHMVKIKTVDAGWFPDEGAIAVETLYEGKAAGEDAVIDTNEVIRDKQTLSAGRHTVNVWWNNRGNQVGEPWLLKVDNVINDPAGDVAYIRVGRWLTENESFFVDGLEYYVSKLHLVGDELKYITLRNPICKGDGEVELEALSVTKTCVPEMENLPFLPPFNMEHDIKDDVGGGGSVLADIPAVDEYWIAEKKEPRFDTNLLEEKFTLPQFVCEVAHVEGEVLEFQGDTLPVMDLAPSQWQGEMAPSESGPSVAATDASIVFDGSPGTAAPPANLGPFEMTDFPPGTDPSYTVVNSVPSPLGGEVQFDHGMEVRWVPATWATWSHGYSDDVYADIDPGTQVVMTMPPNTYAFYFYAEPNAWAEFNITATASDGTTSGPIAVTGLAGAQYFGFYSQVPGVTLTSIQVDVEADAGGYAVGEFGIAQLDTADIEVTDKTCTGPFVPGESFNCTYTVENFGPGPAMGVTLTDMWVDADPGLVSFFAWDGDWGCAADLTCSRTGLMPVGAVETIQITFNLPADAHLAEPDGDWMFNNYTDLTAINEPGDNFKTGGWGPYTMEPEADLELEKVALTPEVEVGGTALFKVTIYNHGPSDAAGVTIAEYPGAGWIDAVIAPTEATGAGLYIPAGGHTEVFVSAKADPDTVEPGDTLENCAEAFADAGYTDPTGNNDDCATVDVVTDGPVWYGPVDMANECFYGAATLGDFFADCNGDGVVDTNDITVYVNGVPVPVLAISPWGYVLLGQDYGDATVTIDYCYTEENFYDDELWQWINIETKPWDYTEFVLPDIAASTGDYLLVSSWTTQTDERMMFWYEPSDDGLGIYVNTLLAEPPCFGDFNGDGTRDTADIMLMIPHWNTTCGDAGYDALFDVDNDCDIDLADIMQVVAVWGTDCP
jgi:hypothetical protein